MRDVVLMHVEDGLSVLDEDQKVYDENLAVAARWAGRIDFDRGYQWVDVRAGAKRFRFVNTHLEAFSSDIAFAQAAQLLRRGDRPRTGRRSSSATATPTRSTSSIKGPPVTTRCRTRRRTS